MSQRFRLPLAALAIFVAMAGDAAATPYQVTPCSTSTSAFALVNPSPGTLSTSGQCPASGTLPLRGVSLAVAESGGTPAGATASWTLAAPAGLQITQLEVRRFLGRRSDSWTADIATAEETVLDTCERGAQPVCTRGGAEGNDTAYFSGLRTPSIAFRVGCRPPADVSECVGRPSTQAWVAIYGANVLVEDSSPPEIHALTSPLFAPGWHRGTGQIGTTALDASGVKALAVSVGGVDLGSRSGACDYSRMQPCAPSLAEAYDVDTSRLGDGTHEVRVTAVDAADQAATATATLRVDRNAPAAPSELAVERNPDGTLALLWTNPGQGTAAPITGARYAVCSALGAGCVGGPLASKQGISRIDSVAIPNGEHMVKVWLQDEAGNSEPANAAVLNVDPSKVTAQRAVDMKPPVLTDGPAPSSRLKITRARRSGSTLTVTGTIARAASARIEAQVSRSKTGKPVVAKVRVKPKRGKWAARVKLPASLRTARAMYLTIKYAGQNEYRATTLKRRLTRKAPRRGQASGEFSVEARIGGR